MISILVDNPQMVWFPIKPGSTIYEGGLVCWDADEGIVMLPQATGASNTTNKNVPLGVCVGLNRRYPVFSSTYKANYITDEGATGLRASTVDYKLAQGEFPYGSKMAYAQIALIDQSTLIRAPLCNGAIDTAPTEVVSTGGNANGLTVTTDACDFTPVADLCTIQARSGLNLGSRRITDDTSTTVATWDRQLLETTATIGEKYVRVPVKMGRFFFQIGSTSANYIDVSASPATNYFIGQGIRLHLDEAGNEYIDFKFDGDNFCHARA